MKAVIAASLLSAAAASSLTWILATSAAPPAPAPGRAPAAADFKAALGDLEREVAALRREMAERPGSGAPGGGPPAATPAADARRSDGSDTSNLVLRPAAGVAASLDPVPPVTPAVVQLLEELSQWHGRPEVRARWTFLPEGKVLEQLGMPDSVVPNQVEEAWIYRVPSGETDEEGNPRWRRYQVTLNRGRLVRVD